MLDFPLFYCNGDSYSNENYHCSLKKNTYAHVVGNYYHGFTINNAITGSCNRRIIRSSVHDLIQQRQQNPTQHIIALIGLSFELRTELWNDNNTNVINEQESNFRPHRFTEMENWKERLLSSLPITKLSANSFEQKFSEGRAYFYSPYAERINLMCDLVMFQALMEQMHIQFLIFQSPIAEKLESEYLLDFFKKQLNPKNFFDFENFSFIEWCVQQKYVPLDFEDRPHIGHYGADAHKAFAEKIIIPHLEQK